MTHAAADTPLSLVLVSDHLACLSAESIKLKNRTNLDNIEAIHSHSCAKVLSMSVIISAEGFSLSPVSMSHIRD